MQIIFIVFFVLLVIFAFVILFGAPYLPTKKQQITDALKLLDLKPGQTLLELGCGDGRVLRAAADQGIKAIGYELNPVLVLIAKLVTWRSRDHVQILWANYWQRQWPPADGIYIFLLDKYMNKLDKKITQQYKGKRVKLVSFAFEIPGKKPAKTKNGLFLYSYGQSKRT